MLSIIMSARSFGESYGYDEINPYDEIPITFEQAQLSSGRNMLLSRNEYPRLDAGIPVEQSALSQKSITRRVPAPGKMVEGFSNNIGINLSQSDQQMIIMFLLIIVVIMQMRQMMLFESRNSALSFGHSFANQPHLSR